MEVYYYQLVWNTSKYSGESGPYSIIYIRKIQENRDHRIVITHDYHYYGKNGIIITRLLYWNSIITHKYCYVPWCYYPLLPLLPFCHVHYFHYYRSNEIITSLLCFGVSITSHFYRSNGFIITHESDA